MTIAGIGVEGHIGHDRHGWVHLLEPTDRPRDQAVLVEALGPILALEAIGHLGEEHHAADAQIPGATHLIHQPFEAPAAGTRHGADRFDAGALVHKEGIDEVGGGELVFPHQGPQGRRAPQPAGTVGELHGACWTGTDPREGLLVPA